MRKFLGEINSQLFYYAQCFRNGSASSVTVFVSIREFPSVPQMNSRFKIRFDQVYIFTVWIVQTPAKYCDSETVTAENWVQSAVLSDSETSFESLLHSLEK